MLTGQRLGPYEVAAKIGEGGMGEVYRATDTNLGRSVAIKVLPEAVASDAERLARFEREARTLATLNHPNIAQIYGLERSTGTTALVMELVPGPTLADRIAQGRLPLDEALPIARQIAEALEAAHEQGIIHRDLKPANIKVRDDGMVKVLDFGLAKAIEPVNAEPAGLSRSPTITTPHMTHVGVILGTPAYMSPEQARGRQIDRRSDIWAFGLILYEMLSGRRAFPDGESVSDTLAGILKGEPDWTALSAETPRTIRSLIERCLRKDLKRRLPDIAQARIEIEDARNEPAPIAGTPTSSVPPNRSLLWPAIAMLALLAAAALGARMLLSMPPASQVVQFDIMPPPGTELAVGQPLSPDGRTVAFLAPFEGKTHIWIRPLDSSTAQPLKGTEDAARPFWSPDSQFLAFFSQGKLKKAAIAGGPPSAICNEPGREGAWGPNDVILIGGRQKPIHRVSAKGGEPVPVTEFGPNETTHDYPEFLPDGRHFFYMARAGGQQEDWRVFVGSLDSKDRTLLSGIQSGVRYSPSGHVLFARDNTLLAQIFDAGRMQLVGEAFAVAERVYQGPHASISVSNNGSLAYLTAPVDPQSQLTWADRTGARQSLVGPIGSYTAIALSPDGKQIAFQRNADLAAELFILNVDRGSLSPFTSNPAADFAPIWSPDGGTIAFASSRDPAGNSGPRNMNGGHLYDRAFGSAQNEKLLLKTDRGKTPTDWSRDGRYLAFITNNDVWALPMPASEGAKPIPVTNTPFVEATARFSPDGRWIAFRSNESGSQTEVWVQSFPEPGQKQQVSTNGGSMPRWRADGKELFYVGPDSTLMAVSIAAGNQLQPGTPVRLFSSRAFGTGGDYDVSRDGRFLLSVPDADATSFPITVIVNWTATLKH